MTPAARKLALTLHLTSSVGWLGAVFVVLGLAFAGLVSGDPESVRAAYIAMDATAWLVLMPLAVASLVTGVVQGLGTHWGLFRHYWVVFKLVINVIASVVLLLYLQTLETLATRSRGPVGLESLRSASPVLHAGAALSLLLVATVLAVYKPRGLTSYGRRRLNRSGT
jgi:hypothetical protein